MNNKKNVIIGCIYKAPHFSISLFNEKLSTLLTTINEENKDVYTVGDFNVKLNDQ